MLTLALIVNPVAGVGGPRGDKGSDHLAGAESETPARALARARRALAPLTRYGSDLDFWASPGAMGGDLLEELGLHWRRLPGPSIGPSAAEDTRRAAQAAREAGVDLLLFVGGDGTARDVCAAVGEHLPVLGIPAGVKMHSGVFAINPEAAAEIIERLLTGGLVDLREQEVRDIDETEFRQGRVRARHYGDMQVPEAGHFLQRVKESGREVEALVLDEIAAEVLDHMGDQVLYIIGPGTTTRAVTEALGLSGTLLGVDLVRGGELVAADVTAGTIEAALAEAEEAEILVTPIGGQGHLFGRGNQQLTPAVLRRVGRDFVRVLATKTKIKELEGRPLLLDTNDPDLDREWSGLIPVITGYRDRILYPLSCT